jgi:hypothetical protein
MLRIERDSELDGLDCRVCHCRVLPGERVLVAYRKGQPSLIHANVCSPSEWRAPAPLIDPSRSLPA